MSALSPLPGVKQKLNVDLLRKIQHHITEEPRRFFMSDFEAHAEPGTRDWEFYLDDLRHKAPACGTAACIAGWANGLTRAPRGEWHDEIRAAQRLGTSAWPEPFKAQYLLARTPRQRAKIACARIDHLIATGE